MKFSYKGKDAKGMIVKGTIEVQTKAEAITHIKDSGVAPLSVEKIGALSMDIGGNLFKKVKLSEKIIFTKNLSGMLTAGLAISRALDVLSRQTANKYFKTVIANLVETIDKGGTLSEGMAKNPKVFEPLFIAMVRAGEESGGLPGVLSEVGMTLEKTYALRRKIKSAMMYPMIIISAIILIGILMFMFVVPTLTKTFKELGAELPLSTKIVVGLSDAISGHPILVFGALFLIVFLIVMAFRLKQTKHMIDFASTRLPAIGPLVQEVNAARTARTLSSLLSSGVSISHALAITKDVLQNDYYKHVMDEAIIVVERGEPMSSVFKEHVKLYPVMVGEMMEVGEETGKLSSMLFDIAVFYEGEVDAKTKDLSTIIEPVLMIFIGAGVGFFAVSMLSPMYSIMDSIK